MNLIHFIITIQFIIDPITINFITTLPLFFLPKSYIFPTNYILPKKYVP